MSKDKQLIQKKQDKAGHKTERIRGQEPEKISISTSETELLLGGDSIEAQQLTLQKVDIAQRQKMIAEMGRIQGNDYVQRLVQTLYQPPHEQTNEVFQHQMKVSNTKEHEISIQSSRPFSLENNAHKAEDTKPFFKSLNTLITTPSIQRQSEPPENLPTLYYGAQGDKVDYLQQLLNSHGATIAIDGIFGPETYQAVRQFQEVHAPPIDGIVGPITWKALTSNSKETVKEEEVAEVYPKDFSLIGQNIFEAKDALEQYDPTAHAMFGSALQQTGNNFLQVANPQAAAKSLFMPIGLFNTTSSDLTAETLERELDMLLKFIAISVDSPSFGGMNKVSTLEMIREYVQTQGLSPLPEAEVKLFLNRVNLMHDFYDSFSGKGNTTSTAQIEDQKPIEGPYASDRQRLVGIALSDVGKVRAHENPRYGWKHLKQIYDVAFNGKHPFPDSYFQNYVETDQCAHGDELCVKTNKVLHSKPLVKRDHIGSWCGIGAMYWLKVAGQTDLEWQFGVSGLANKLKPRPFTELPEVGDVVINKSLDHHGIITWIDPNAEVPKNQTEWNAISIKTVESNIEGGQINHAPAGHGQLGYFNRGAFNSFERQ